MGSFGERLRREREMRGIGLEEIAEATKIGTRSLRALEEQDFDKLPGGIFNKGFVRAYSKYLGIDEDQAVADYVSAVSEAQATGKITRAELGPPSLEGEEPRPEPIRIPWTLLAGVVLVVAVGFAARSYYSKYGLPKLWRHSTEAQAASPLPVNPHASTPASVTPVGMTATPPAKPETNAAQAGSSTASQPAATAQVTDGFVVKVHANELAWVDIRADGKRIMSEIMPANTDQVVRATKEVVVKTGNAGGIELTHNDKLLPPIGPKHEVRTVTLTAQGVTSDQ